MKLDTNEDDSVEFNVLTINIDSESQNSVKRIKREEKETNYEVDSEMALMDKEQ